MPADRWTARLRPNWRKPSAYGARRRMPTSPNPQEYRSVLLDILAGAPEAFLHPHDAAALGVRPLERIRIRVLDTNAEFPAVVNVSPSVAHEGTIGLSKELAARMRLPSNAR